MILVMKPTATEENIQSVIQNVKQCGLDAHLSRGQDITIIGVVGNKQIFLQTCQPQ